MQPLPFYGAADIHQLGKSALRASGSITASSMSIGSVGTGFGQETAFNTTPVRFERHSNQPQVVQTIFYDSADNLQKMGIRLKERNSYQTRVAFPGSEPGFCKPPPSWVRKTQ